MAVDFNTATGATPSIGFASSNKIIVNTAKFGDGYSQRTVSGLNPNIVEYSVKFQHQPLTKAATIIGFLQTAGTGDPTKGGVEYFTWTPPGESTAIKVICSEWDVEYASTISRTINAKFVRVYDI